MNEMNAILVANNLSYKYLENSKQNILEHYSIYLKQGEITLLCGKSGCGKSTLAYILAGLYPQNGGFLTSGTVLVEGKNIHQLPQNKRVRYISMMFQNCDLQFCMNHLQNELLFCLENIGIQPHQAQPIIQDVTRRVGVESLLTRDFHTLSGGEKQKCALCCILALESKCIILDEAFANIDAASAREIIGLLKQLNRTILAIEHNVALWDGAYDRIISMDQDAPRCDGLVFAKQFYQGASATELATQSTQNTPPILSIKNLIINKIEYGEMEFEKGSITAIVGKSGSGKTTLFKTLIGQHKYHGSIELLGEQLRKIKKHDLFSKCGIVFQNPSNQFLSMTVYDEVMFSVKRWHKDKDKVWQAEKTKTLLEFFNLRKYQNYPPYLLSQGQQRRLAVIAMIAGEQQILLLDEPTYGQDYDNILAMMELIDQKARLGLTIILSTHNEQVANHFANRRYTIGE